MRTQAHPLRLSRMDTHGAARVAHLHYVHEGRGGIRRIRDARGVQYVGPRGRAVSDAPTLKRIRALVLPPAWTDVWICADPKGHIQATGRDARGRKQYRYHAQWRAVRDETKFGRMLVFAKALPRIRRRVARDLRQRGLPRTKVLAAVVRLLEGTFIRVGNDEYAKHNDSYGITTLRDDHATFHGSKMEFTFRGKSGVMHTVDFEDARVAAIVKECQALPGQELLQYVDSDGKVHDIKSDDVNAYLHEVSGEEFSAKDFRTWAGTVLAALALEELGTFDSKAQGKKNVVRAVQQVAGRLGNTPTVCKKCYVHPEVISAYLDGELVQALARGMARVAEDKGPTLSRDEAAVVALLRRRLAAEGKARGLARAP